MVRFLSPKAFVAALLAAPISAELLYATSYNDHAVTVLDLKDGELKVLDKSLDCGSEPTWLTLDKAQGVLYCLNEGWGGAASITSFKTSKEGKLTTLNILPVLKTPVASTLFGKNKGLAVAHYDTSAFTTYNVAKPENLQLYFSQNYTLAAPGPRPDRQEAPHVHDAQLDPTGKFIVAADLGSDAIHVFEVGKDLSTTPRLPSIKTPAGAGPRHVAFAKTASGTYLYSFNELSNTVTGYKIEYAGPELKATQLFDVATRPAGETVPAGTKAAEIEVSSDQKFIIVSSRGENNLQIPAFGAAAGARIVSDPLVVFKIDQATGSIEIVQRAPAGGKNPRGFSINKAGTLVASALQDDNRVVIYARDVETGKLGDVVAYAKVGDGENNGPNYVIFDE